MVLGSLCPCQSALGHCFSGHRSRSSKEGQPCSGRKKVCTLITLGGSGAWLTSVLQTELVFRKTATLCGHHVQLSVNAGPEA